MAKGPSAKADGPFVINESCHATTKGYRTPPP